MSTTPTTVPTKRLAESIKSDATSFKLNNYLGWDGNTLDGADFGTVGYGCFRNSAGTLMELFSYDAGMVAGPTINFIKRGLKFNGDLTTEVAANKRAWVKGDTIVELGSNTPQMLMAI